MNDIDQIASLLHIYKESLAHGTSLQHLRDAALAQLKKLNEMHAPAAPAPEPMAKALPQGAPKSELGPSLADRAKAALENKDD